MPNVLRRRLALVALLGVFLIPVVSTNLRGLTHLLSCEDDAATPFSLVIDERGRATISSSSTYERDPETGEVRSGGGRDLCGGLDLFLAVSDADATDGRIELTVPITNQTDRSWQGSVELRLGSLRLPVGIGRIGPGETATDVLEISLGEGSHELTGALLIGP